MSIDNKPNPPRRDESDDSVDSTPERDQNPPATASANVSQDVQQPKRKGGRKPVSRHALTCLLPLLRLVRRRRLLLGPFGLRLLRLFGPRPLSLTSLATRPCPSNPPPLCRVRMPARPSGAVAIASPTTRRHPAPRPASSIGTRQTLRPVAQARR